MAFRFRTILTGLAVGGASSALMAVPGQAATFTPFSFSTTWSGNSPDGDVLLESVSYDDLEISEFELVSDAEILFNEEYTGGDTGALSTDHGIDTVAEGLVGEGPAVEDPDSSDVVAALGNLNLNSIIDTEDDGEARLLVSFDQPTSQFLFWERGINSDLRVEALDSAGEVIADYLITRDMVEEAGFTIRTTEIAGNSSEIQPVGSIGLKLNGDTTQALRLSSIASFQGPDYKVIAVKDEPTAVPEPGSLIGLGLVAGLGALQLRQRLRSDA